MALKTSRACMVSAARNRKSQSRSACAASASTTFAARASKRMPGDARRATRRAMSTLWRADRPPSPRRHPGRPARRRAGHGGPRRDNAAHELSAGDRAKSGVPPLMRFKVRWREVHRIDSSVVVDSEIAEAFIARTQYRLLDELGAQHAITALALDVIDA